MGDKIRKSCKSCQFNHRYVCKEKFCAISLISVSWEIKCNSYVRKIKKVKELVYA